MDQTPIATAEDASTVPLETVQVRELETDGDAGGDWITRLLASGLFRHLPPEHSHRFFAELEPVSLRAGQVVIKQDEQSRYFYVITHGRCAVTRRVPSSHRELQLDVLREGDAFGEASLISGTPTTTTVRMLSDGTLMRLARDRFEQLVAAPTLSVVSYDEGRRLVDDGALWLHVRDSDRDGEDAFDGSLSMPYHVLSIEAPRLDSAKTYVVYCESGAYSATGTFLLRRLGFEAHVLDGGLSRMRHDARCAVEPASGEPAAAEHAAPGPSAGTTAASGSGDRIPEDHATTEGVTTEEGSPGVVYDREPQTTAPTSLAAEKDYALAAARRAEERARVLGRHNETLKHLLELQREKLRAAERQFADVTERLANAEAHLVRSDQRLSQSLAMHTDSSERLTATTGKLVETCEALASARGRLCELEQELSVREAQRAASEAAPSVDASRLAQIEGELAATREELTCARSERAEAQTAREVAEAALDVAFAELRRHIDGLATLRTALTGTAGDD